MKSESLKVFELFIECKFDSHLPPQSSIFLFLTMSSCLFVFSSFGMKIIIILGGGPHTVASRLCQEEGGEEVFTPASGRSPHSSLSSPQVSVDSPRICFSPLRIKDSIEEEDETGHVIHRYCTTNDRCSNLTYITDKSFTGTLNGRCSTNLTYKTDIS